MPRVLGGGPGGGGVFLWARYPCRGQGYAEEGQDYAAYAVLVPHIWVGNSVGKLRCRGELRCLVRMHQP